MNTRSAVRQALRLITHHIGLGGDAHPDVTELKSGFMSPTMFKAHNTIFKRRTAIQNSAGTDILKLPIGYYSGSNFINHPASKPTELNTAHSYVSVIPSSQDTRRLIVLVEAASGRIWTRTVNDTYDVNNDWSKVDQYVTLWKGYSELKNPVTLSKPVRQNNGSLSFSEIKVKFATGSNVSDLMPVNLDTGSFNNTSIIDNDRTSQTTYEANIQFETKDGTSTAVITKNFGLNIYPNVNDENDARIQILNESVLNIVEIRGYY